MVAILVLVTEMLGHSDIIVVGATEAGDGITDGNWEGFLVSCNEGMEDEMMEGLCDDLTYGSWDGLLVSSNEGMEDGMMDGIRVGRVFPE